FFPKKFGEKIGAVLQWRISGMVCVRVLLLLHPAPRHERRNTPSPLILWAVSRARFTFDWNSLPEGSVLGDLRRGRDELFGSAAHPTVSATQFRALRGVQRPTRC